MRPANDQKFSDYLRFFNVISNFERWYRTGVTIRELSKLNDFQLADIGISRDRIPVAANDAVNALIDGRNIHA